MIVSGGENIYSAEVERALAAHPSVQSVAVGAPDEKWGERVVAFVVTYPDRPVDVSDLVSHCRGLITGYKVPKEIHLMDALPQTRERKGAESGSAPTASGVTAAAIMTPIALK